MVFEPLMSAPLALAPLLLPPLLFAPLLLAQLLFVYSMIVVTVVSAWILHYGRLIKVAQSRRAKDSLWLTLNYRRCAK